MEQLVNQSIARYRLDALLGEGGMGAVFKAFDVTLQRDVAVKVMHPHFAKLPNFQERFLQEARTAARLNHASIVQVYDFGQDRGRLYIVMKFISGKNLEKVLELMQQQKLLMPLAEATELVAEVSQALDYAHHMGVLHRDIKPANIMIEPDSVDRNNYRPVLTDLGLAKLAEGGMHTMDGQSMGTPAYMSPEQALGQKTDPRSDVYSLGVLLFELCTGRRPFPAGSLTEAIRFHTQEPPPRPALIRPEISAGLEQVILKAMEKDPARRFSSAGELASAVLAAAASQPDPGTTTAVNTAGTATAVSGPAVQPGKLVTQFSESAPDGRGVSVFSGKPAPGPSSQDRIQLLAKDGTTRLIPLNKPALTLGRGDENDVVLADGQASRRHARIDCAEGKVRVTDLNSTNGTYLAGARLLPGIAEDWSPDKALRIGDTALRLLQAGEGLPDSQTDVHRRGQPVATAGTMAQPAGAAVSGMAGESRIGVAIDSPALTLTPGQSASLVVSLFNQGAVVDHFRMEVQGIPARWVAAQPGLIQLMPGARQTVTLSLQAPRSPESRSGRYPVVVRVTSQDNPNQAAEARLTLTVAPYSQFSAELFPQRLNAGRTGRLTVRNAGNTQETFAISFTDRADELAFQPPSQQVRVPEGQTVTAEYRAQLRQRRWIGGEKQHAFSARIALPQGEPQTQNGELVSRGLIPPWVLPLMMLFFMLLVAGGGLAWNSVQTRNREATQTAVSANTAVAAAVAGTSLAVTEAVAGTALAETQQVMNTESTAKSVAETQQSGTQQAAIQGTADAVKAENDALIAALTQNAVDALNAQNAQTATAMAGQVQTLQAQQTVEAQMAQQALTETEAARLTMTMQAAQAQTSGAMAELAKERDFFVSGWYNPSPVENQLTRLVIEKVDDSTLKFHAWNECAPEDCDIGTNESVAFTMPTLSANIRSSKDGLLLTFSRTIKATKNPNGTDLDVTVEIYSFFTRTTTTYYYTFKRELFLLPIKPILILP
jgi:eukaryotic-like serine/threonine-protein kinase